MAVTRGERVRFVFRNQGSVAHEAFIGDAGVQALHDREMSAGAHHHDAGLPAVDVAPGSTGQILYTFSRPGEVLIGCHVPGHYLLGMRAVITVS
jgi:uncharacterized cupredoxin-like copper-binding protein